jgi:DNA repair photolyase
VIVSASYKTDIPAFYGAWFMNRLEAGFCRVTNPYGGPPSRVALDREAVDGFVFWTKNAGPFLDTLAEVAKRGFPFVVHYSINGYPRELEQATPDRTRACEHLRRIASDFGPEVAVWRYDPVLVTNLTPRDWHRAHFERIAASLAGATNEVVISFAHFYAKTRRNMAAAARSFGLAWEDPEAEWKRALAAELADIAAGHGMALRICAQPQYLAGRAEEARCIDAERLSRVAGRTITARRKGNRPDCACFASRDIGEYDTCPMGCVYCYAVRTRALARARFRAHDEAAEFLFAPPAS